MPFQVVNKHLDQEKLGNLLEKKFGTLRVIEVLRP
jgi:hypothetical protein